MPMSDYIRNLRALIGTTVLETPTVSVLVFDADDRVLLVRHAEGNDWTTPGGMIEPYETPADAAVRETWEETGLFVALTRIVGVFGRRRVRLGRSKRNEAARAARAVRRQPSEQLSDSERARARRVVQHDDRAHRLAE